MADVKKIKSKSKKGKPFTENGKQLVKESGIKKPRRNHSGTVALREIRRFQKSTDTLLRRGPFSRLVKEILEEIRVENEKEAKRVFEWDCKEIGKSPDDLEFQRWYRMEFGKPALAPNETSGPWCEVTRTKKETIDALQQAVEPALTSMFAGALVYSIHAGRKTLNDKDLRLFSAMHPNIVAANDDAWMIGNIPRYPIRDRASKRVSHRPKKSKALGKTVDAPEPMEVDEQAAEEEEEVPEDDEKDETVVPSEADEDDEEEEEEEEEKKPEKEIEMEEEREDEKDE